MRESYVNFRQLRFAQPAVKEALAKLSGGQALLPVPDSNFKGALYEEALRRTPDAYCPTVKLSDVFFVLGDAANEKVYREKMSGALTE